MFLLFWQWSPWSWTPWSWHCNHDHDYWLWQGPVPWHWLWMTKILGTKTLCGQSSLSSLSSPSSFSSPWSFSSRRSFSSLSETLKSSSLSSFLVKGCVVEGLLIFFRWNSRPIWVTKLSFWKFERGQQLCWCDPGVWGWSAGGSSQGDLGWAGPLLNYFTAINHINNINYINNINTIYVIC